MYRTKARKIELRFAANDLVNKDIFSLSDPFLVCHTVRDGRHHTEIGRTETVQDDLNPVWATTFSFDYDASLHAHTTLVVDLFDRDSATETSLSKHDFLGRAFFRLSDLLDTPTMHLNLPLKPVSAKLSSATSGSSTSSVTDAEDEGGKQYLRNHKWCTTKQSRQKDLEEELSSVNGLGYDFSSNSVDFHPSSSSSSSQPGSYRGLKHKLSSFNHEKNAVRRSTDQSNSSEQDSSRLLPTPRKSRSRTNSSAIKASSSSNDLIRATSGSRAQKVSGSVDIYAEEVRQTKSNLDPFGSRDGVMIEPGRILLRVRSASLKTVNGVRGFRTVTQFYELQRERVCGAWNCVYRSNDGMVVDRENYVAFDDVVIDEQTMNNLQGDRKLRLAFYQRHTKKQHTLISYITTTLSNIRRTTSPSNHYQVLNLKMEGAYTDDDGLGNVLISRIRFGSSSSAPSSGQQGGDDIKTSSALEDEDDGVTDVLFNKHAHDSILNDEELAEYRLRSMSVAANDGDLQPTPTEGSRNMALECRADHFLNKKYTSSLNSGPKFERRRFQKPAFISLH